MWGRKGTIGKSVAPLEFMSAEWEGITGGLRRGIIRAGAMKTSLL